MKIILTITSVLTPDAEPKKVCNCEMIPCQNGEPRHTFNRNGDAEIPKRRQSIKPKTVTVKLE